MTTKTASFEYSHTVGFLAYRGRGFIHPIALTLGDDGVMYVLNRGGPESVGRLEHKRVCVCAVDEGYIGEWGTGGTADGQFWWPRGIAKAPTTVGYSSPTKRCSTSTSSTPTGIFVRHWGEAGDTHGVRFNRPAGIAVAPDGTLLISDGLNHRIQRFSTEGEYLRRLG